MWKIAYELTIASKAQLLADFQNVKWKVQGMPQTQSAANPRHQEEEKKTVAAGVYETYGPNICMSLNITWKWRNLFKS